MYCYPDIFIFAKYFYKASLFGQKSFFQELLFC